jgi:archaellum component FlaF (FlaF/FlaG flagellin family)
MKNLIFSATLAIFSFVGYSQTSVTITNNTSDILDVGAIATMQSNPCGSPFSDDIPALAPGDDVTITFPFAHYVSLVGVVSGAGDGYSYTHVGCGPDDLDTYGFFWTSGPSAFNVEIW